MIVRFLDIGESVDHCLNILFIIAVAFFFCYFWGDIQTSINITCRVGSFTFVSPIMCKKFKYILTNTTAVLSVCWLVMPQDFLG